MRLNCGKRARLVPLYKALFLSASDKVDRGLTYERFDLAYVQKNCPDGAKKVAVGSASSNVVTRRTIEVHLNVGLEAACSS